jgi:fatty acyl-CoA reductase
MLITGGTGFLGKALLEKLLRSCPDVGNIYVLVRPRKGKDPSERIVQITNDQVICTLADNMFNPLKPKLV